LVLASPLIDLIKYKCLEKEEYHIKNVLFHIPSIHDFGRPLDYPFTLGSIIPIRVYPNHSLFIYAGLDEPQDIPLKHHLKEKFYAKIEYLSYPKLVCKLFAK